MPRPDIKRGHEPFPTTREHLGQMVHQAVFAQAKGANKALRDLSYGLNQSPDYAPVLQTIEIMQGLWLDPNQTQRLGRDRRFSERAREVLSELLMRTGSRVGQRGERHVAITPSLLKLLDRLEENDHRLRKLPDFSVLLPQNYDSVPMMVANLKNSAEQGAKRLGLTFALPAKPAENPEERQAMLEAHNQWTIQVNQALNQDQYDSKDTVIDLIKTEPDASIMPDNGLYKKNYNGISLQEIEESEEPTEADVITDYLTAAVSELKTPNHIELLARVFFRSPRFLNAVGEPITYQNARLVETVTTWQHVFMEYLYYDQNSSRNEKITKFLKTINSQMLYSILMGVWLNTTHKFTYTTPQEIDQDSENPIYDEAIESYVQSRTPDSPYQYAEEITHAYFMSTALPKLEERLKTLGAESKYKEIKDYYREVISHYSFEEEHLDFLQAYFEHRCGPLFLNSLNEHEDDIESKTQAVVDDIYDQGLHFLPSRKGYSTVNFSAGSVASNIGLSAINIKTVGDTRDWHLDIVFMLEASQRFSTQGVMQRDGTLTLRAPIQEHIPGLFTMLRLIGVSVFHDLVIQKKKETEAPTQRATDQENDDQEHQIYSRESDSGSLPREQSDKELVRNIYQSTGYTPREVDLHVQTLPFMLPYKKAVTDYNVLIAQGASEEAISLARQTLETTKAAAKYRPSDSKLEHLPAGFELENIIDPVTGAETCSQTWVVAHTSPKPTNEELQYQATLFRKYYKGSSAIASLDQMKPWFVGL